MWTKSDKLFTSYYDQLTIDNNTKDVELLRLLQGIKFESTGKTNQDETQPEHKMSNFQGVAMCSALFHK